MGRGDPKEYISVSLQTVCLSIFFNYNQILVDYNHLPPVGLEPTIFRLEVGRLVQFGHEGMAQYNEPVLTGFEPVTPRLTAVCSNQLSYRTLYFAISFLIKLSSNNLLLGEK